MAWASLLQLWHKVLAEVSHRIKYPKIKVILAQTCPQLH